MAEIVAGQASEFGTSQANQSSCQTRSFAGFWMRFWAYLIDLLILGSINSLLMGPFKLFTNLSQSIFGSWTIYGVVAFVIYFAYFTFITKIFKLMFGKMILGIEVVRKDGKLLTWSDVIFKVDYCCCLYNSFFFL